MPQLQPDNALGFLLTDVSRLFRQAFERAVVQAGLELTPGEIRALAHAARHPGARQAVLAERMGVEPMTLSAYLDRLESRGLIRRSVDPKDRRANMIHPTELAERVFDEVRPVVMQVYDRMTAGLEKGEIEAAQRALARIRDNLSGEPAGPESLGSFEERAGNEKAPTPRAEKDKVAP